MLALEWSPAVAGDFHLCSARVVQPARQVDEWQIGRLAVPRAWVAIMAARPDLADHRRRHRISFGTGNGDDSAGGKTQPIGVAKARGQHVNRLAVGRDAKKPLFARNRVEPASTIALEPRDEIVTGRRSLVGVAHAFIKVGFTISVEVMQTRDLVAAEHVDHAIGDDQAECLVQTRCKSPPAHLVQRGIEPVHPPDVSLHGAEHGRAIGQEVVIAEEERGLPRILERRLDRVDRIGTLLPWLTARLEHLRPLWRSSPGQARKRVASCRGDHPRELPALHPGCVEELLVADAIGKDHALAMAIEATVCERLLGLRTRGTRQGDPVHDQAVEETVPDRRELHETADPERLVRERLGIEDRTHFSVFTESHADCPWGRSVRCRGRRRSGPCPDRSGSSGRRPRFPRSGYPSGRGCRHQGRETGASSMGMVACERKYSASLA